MWTIDMFMDSSDEKPTSYLVHKLRVNVHNTHQWGRMKTLNVKQTLDYQYFKPNPNQQYLLMNKGQGTPE
jgi:hypothetical protein